MSHVPAISPCRGAQSGLQRLVGCPGCPSRTGQYHLLPEHRRVRIVIEVGHACQPCILGQAACILHCHRLRVCGTTGAPWVQLLRFKCPCLRSVPVKEDTRSSRKPVACNLRNVVASALRCQIELDLACTDIDAKDGFKRLDHATWCTEGSLTGTWLTPFMCAIVRGVSKRSSPATTRSLGTFRPMQQEALHSSSATQTS